MIGCFVKPISSILTQLDRALDSDSGDCRREIDNLTLVPVAQLDRALDSDSKGQRFESSRARQNPLIRRLFRGFNFSSFFKTCDNATNQKKALFRVERERPARG